VSICAELHPVDTGQRPTIWMEAGDPPVHRIHRTRSRLRPLGVKPCPTRPGNLSSPNPTA